MTPVGFEPTQLALVELESTPLDHSGKVSWDTARKHCPTKRALAKKLRELSHVCASRKWSHAGLNRGPYGY